MRYMGFSKHRCRHTTSLQQSHLKFLDLNPFASSLKMQRSRLLLISLSSLCPSGVLSNSMSTLIFSLSLGCRTGYLLDRISIEEPLVVNTFSTLLKELCRVLFSTFFSRTHVEQSWQTSKCFDETLHLYEPIANQSFIVNKSLLFRKLELLLTQYASNPYPIFLLLQKRGEICQVCIVPIIWILHVLNVHQV